VLQVDLGAPSAFYKLSFFGILENLKYKYVLRILVRGNDVTFFLIICGNRCIVAS
jgi:hypothetical protein